MKKYLLIMITMMLLLGTSVFAVEPDDIGLYQQGIDALIAKDYSTAIELFDRAAEATPDNKSIWYHSACAYALSNDSLKAIEMLENAFIAGYDNYRGVGRDPDFASIKEMEAFKDIVARMTELANDKRANTHYVKQTIYSPYKLELPDGYDPEDSTTYPLVVVLMFDDEMNEDAITKLKMNDVIFLYANAPYHNFTDKIHYAYWPRGLPSREHYEQVYKMNSDWIASTVESAIQTVKVDTSRVAVFGFSQGGSMTYSVVMDYPNLFDYAAPLGGWIAPFYRSEDCFQKVADSGIELFIGHASDDPVINFSRADSASKWLGDAGVNFTRATFTGGHDLTEEMANGLREWLMKSFKE